MPTDPDTAPVLLDTSAVIAHMIGHPKISRRIKAAERCFLPLTALGELRHGVHKSERQGRTKEAAKIERVLRIAEVLYPGDQTADQYGRMIDALEAQGQRIPTNDIWIAATAKQYDLPLILFAPYVDHKREATPAARSTGRCCQGQGADSQATGKGIISQAANFSDQRDSGSSSDGSRFVGGTHVLLRGL